ncbi:MAG: ATP-binding protein [Myxococcales bacterium]|nr:ATP-binding protein [Myxococcales bacterium]MCB9642858.1 ATP-binding protein [Myxococcales bacterium]
MLKYLELNHVGPAPKLEIEFNERLNFLTGDNGLGKTFLLDIAWWALTRTWARSPARPQYGKNKKPFISYSYATKTKKAHRDESQYDYKSQNWQRKRGRPSIPGMVIYAQVDGGFSVWDPARNYWKTQEDSLEQPRAFLFDPKEVWNGLEGTNGKALCNGLIADWAVWQSKNNDAFGQLKRVLKRLSPSLEEPLVPGELTRISIDDAREYPTIKMPYDQDVSLVHSSAGLRRIVTLAYLLVWTWQEHIIASEFLGQPPTKEIIFLIDEIEAHLHPKWQRSVVPSILEVMEALTGEHSVPVQLIAATHSPLIMASLEPFFDTKKDAVWELELQQREVILKRFNWRKYGDVNNWLSSDIFELGHPTSLEAERALKEAHDILRKGSKAILEDLEMVDQKLRGVLRDTDPFWIRWSAHLEEVRGEKL